ncbi:hypothetical protein [Solirubrobacter pauli]|uniref:hypothetical protein n=1 Tax=Solirubrobacter pauli TaxID=166793 RepID=UPI0011C3C343|nr:hypothetical protein [Solirubrobacter pauli]
MSFNDALADACCAWQDNRDAGSTPIRAAAHRALGVPHYFTADWLHVVENQAASDARTMKRARVLMQALADSQPTDAAGW